jgi:hypothetical protein
LCGGGGGGADPNVVQDMFATSPQLNRNPRVVPPGACAALRSLFCTRLRDAHHDMMCHNTPCYPAGAAAAGAQPQPQPRAGSVTVTGGGGGAATGGTGGSAIGGVTTPGTPGTSTPGAPGRVIYGGGS